MGSIKKTIDERFEEWIAANPSIVDMYLKFSLEALFSGRKRYSIKAITERVRWEHNIKLKSKDEFKINDHFSAPMARLMVNRDGRLHGLFQFRLRTSAPKPQPVIEGLLEEPVKEVAHAATVTPEQGQKTLF